MIDGEKLGIFALESARIAIEGEGKTSRLPAKTLEKHWPLDLLAARFDIHQS